MAENDNERLSGEAGKEPRVIYEDDEQENGIFRWMSGVVVLLAVAGFFGLAWYAYKSGGEAVDEKDVELVKADKTPVKETPVNPGGMQIPNQDKTVYGLIGGTKTDKPTVERILPAPEEPIARGEGTETWMSDKAKNKVNGEEGTGVTAMPPAVAPAEASTTEVKKTEQFNPQSPLLAKSNQAVPKPAENNVKPNNIVAAAPMPSPAIAKPVVAVAPAPKPIIEAKNDVPEPEKQAPVASESPEEPDEPKAEAASALAPSPSAAPTPKGARAQLGAFKSDEEAKSNWAKIYKQFGSELNGKEHYIVRVDLGEKGVYYRLQVTPFASAKEAENFCLTFVSAGQNCLAKAK